MKTEKNVEKIFFVLVSLPALIITGLGMLITMLGNYNTGIQMVVMFLSVAFLLWRIWPNRQDTLWNFIVFFCTIAWFLVIWIGSRTYDFYFLSIYLSILVPLMAIFVFAKGTPFLMKICVLALFGGIGFFNVYHNDIMDPTLWWMKEVSHPAAWPRGYRYFWAEEVVDMTVWRASISSCLLLAGYKVFRQWKDRGKINLTHWKEIFFSS